MCSNKGTRYDLREKKEKRNKVEISNLPDKEVIIMIIKMLTKLGRINEHSENFNRKLENMKIDQKD